MIPWFWIPISVFAGGLLGAAVVIFLAALSGSKNEFFNWINDNDYE